MKFEINVLTGIVDWGSLYCSSSGQKPNVCAHCTESFEHKYTLKRHVFEVHMKLWNYFCVHCNKCFGRLIPWNDQSPELVNILKPYLVKCSLRTYTNTAYYTIMSFICPHCCKLVMPRSLLWDHNTTKHLISGRTLRPNLYIIWTYFCCSMIGGDIRRFLQLLASMTVSYSYERYNLKMFVVEKIPLTHNWKLYWRHVIGEAINKRLQQYMCQAAVVLISCIRMPSKKFCCV